MRYEITPQISEFLNGALAYAPGACADTAKKYGISPAIICRIMKGTKPGVDERTWLKLCSAFPALRSMVKPYIRKVAKQSSPDAVGAYRLRATDSVLKEARLDDRSKMLVLQILAEAVDGQ